MNRNQPIKPEHAPRILMFICASLIMGCLVFVGLISMIAKMQENWLATGILTLFVLAMAMVCLPLSIFLPPILARSMVNRSRRDSGPGNLKTDPDAMTRIATSAVINKYVIRYALLEGVAFFGAIVMLLEGSWIAMGIVLFMIALMMAMFPLPPRFEDSRDDLIRQMKS